MISMGTSANGRVEIEVAKAEAIPATRDLIATSVDPCMFTVTKGEPVSLLPG